MALCTLQSTHKIPSLLLTTLIFLYCSVDRVPDFSSLFSYLNEFTVKDYFAFAVEIAHQECKLFMDSLDVDSLFTNIPLEGTINICTNLLYNNEDVYRRYK